MLSTRVTKIGVKSSLKAYKRYEIRTHVTGIDKCWVCTSQSDSTRDKQAVRYQGDVYPGSRQTARISAEIAASLSVAGQLTVEIGVLGSTSRAAAYAMPEATSVDCRTLQGALDFALRWFVGGARKLMTE